VALAILVKATPIPSKNIRYAPATVMLQSGDDRVHHAEFVRTSDTWITSPVWPPLTWLVRGLKSQDQQRRRGTTIRTELQNWTVNWTM